MKNFKLLLFLLMSYSCNIFAQAQTLINVNYDPENNCVTASFNECSIFIQGTISGVNSCECHRECNEIQPTEEEIQEH